MGMSIFAVAWGSASGAMMREEAMLTLLSVVSSAASGLDGALACKGSWKGQFMNAGRGLRAGKMEGELLTGVEGRDGLLTGRGRKGFVG